MGGKTSPASINKYMNKAYDRITIIVPKGEKSTIQAHAAAVGMSVNAYINQAIQAYMDARRGNAPEPASNAPVSPSDGVAGGGGVHVPPDAEKPIETF